jgi:hypothetical protein
MTDLNNDGNLDIVTGEDDISISLGNGDGSFQSPVYYNAASNPRSVAVGDFDGNGSPDLAVANTGSGNISILLGDGDGTFQSSVNIGNFSYPNEIGFFRFKRTFGRVPVSQIE